MAESADQQQFRRDAELLAQLGASLNREDLPDIEVRLPRTLAQAVVAAWERADLNDWDTETPEQRAVRLRAAALALIGLAVKERGRQEADTVVVALPPDLIGAALDAADHLPSP
jgi:hypothetical protein